MIAAPDLLVSLVGHNPMSALVATRSLKPRSVLLVATHETEHFAERLGKLVGVPNTVSVGDANPGVDQLVDELHEDIGEELRQLDAPEGRICLDMTGATKPISVAAWLACARHRARDFDVVYLEREGHLVNARDASPVPSDVVIDPEEFVTVRGWRVDSARWRGTAATVLPECRKREALGRAMLADILSGAPRGLTAWDLGRRQPALLGAPGLDLGRGNSRRASASHPYFARNEWLEEVCLVVAADAVTGRPEARLALGMQIDHPGGAHDEIDVIVTRGARAIVIEAKTLVLGAGEAVQKREAKTVTAVDGLARVVFVRPWWRNSAPGNLAIARTTTLVGADAAQLRGAIRKGLGLA